MKKGLLIFGVAATLVVAFNYQASTSSSTPPAAHTGAPGETTCAASGCHTGNLNTGSGNVAILNAPANYVPGQTYNLQVQVTDGTKTRFGFELVVLNSSNQQAGTLTLVNTANTALLTQAGKTYLSHRNASTTSTWSFTWVAPAANVGPVTFYMAGNGANNNGSTSGDNIYTRSLTLQPGTATGIAEDKTAGVKIFPNPAADKLHITFADKAENLKVLDLSGREVFRRENNDNSSQLDVSNYPNGTYFLQVEQEKTLVLKRFVVQH